MPVIDAAATVTAASEWALGRHRYAHLHATDLQHKNECNIICSLRHSATNRRRSFIDSDIYSHLAPFPPAKYVVHSLTTHGATDIDRATKYKVKAKARLSKANALSLKAEAKNFDLQAKVRKSLGGVVIFKLKPSY